MTLCKILALAAAFSAGFPSAAPAAVSRNLTGNNRLVLAAKINDLQNTELMSLTRGRRKANPVQFPLHTVYQTVLQDQELLIRNQTENFANALAGLETVFKNFPSELASDEGREIEHYFRTELIRQYDLEPALSGAKSLLQVSKALDCSRFGMEALPVRAGLALNSLRWMSKKYKTGEPPARIIDRLNPIMKKWDPAPNVFKMDSALRELSAEYSRLFLSLAEEKPK